MSGSDRGRFVEEKQFGVTTRSHNGSVAVLEFQLTDDPSFQYPAAFAQTLCVIVQNAPVAHEHTARWNRDDLTGRGDPVLQRSPGLHDLKPESCFQERAAALQPFRINPVSQARPSFGVNVKPGGLQGSFCLSQGGEGHQSRQLHHELTKLDGRDVASSAKRSGAIRRPEYPTTAAREGARRGAM